LRERLELLFPAALASRASLLPPAFYTSLRLDKRNSLQLTDARPLFPATLHLSSGSQLADLSTSERGKTSRVAMMALPPPPFPTRFSDDHRKSETIPQTSDTWPEPGETVQEHSSLKWVSVKTEQEQYIDQLGKRQSKEGASPWISS